MAPRILGCFDAYDNFCGLCFFVSVYSALSRGSLVGSFKKADLDGYGYKQNDFHFNISMKSHIMNISLS